MIERKMKMGETIHTHVRYYDMIGKKCFDSDRMWRAYKGELGKTEKKKDEEKKKERARSGKEKKKEPRTKMVRILRLSNQKSRTKKISINKIKKRSLISPLAQRPMKVHACNLHLWSQGLRWTGLGRSVKRR